MRALELFSGIGGFAAATAGVPTVAAVDISQPAARVYEANFSHRCHVREITALDNETLAGFGANLWWMSPPCQPFTRRGQQADIADPRCTAFLRLLDAIAEIRPEQIALENVHGFETSIAFDRLQQVLEDADYHWASTSLCSSQFGLPNRRPRFFLLASRRQTVAIAAPPSPVGRRRIGEFLDPDPVVQACADELAEPGLSAYTHAADVVDAESDLSTCFTAAYGHSLVRSGSYLRTERGVRRFTPREIARLLGFSEEFKLPRELNTRQLWKLLGNSLSVPCVRHLLRGWLNPVAL